MFERFTDHSRHVLVSAQEEARRLDHPFIGTEHILLGLIDVGNGVAGRILVGCGVTLEAARSVVVTIIGTGHGPVTSPPFTPRAKKVLELSLREALQLGDEEIRPEHLLLGLIREGEGVACQVMARLGVEPRALRPRVIALIAEDIERGRIRQPRRRGRAWKLPSVEWAGPVPHDVPTDRLLALYRELLVALVRRHSDIVNDAPAADYATFLVAEAFSAELTPGMTGGCDIEVAGRRLRVRVSLVDPEGAASHRIPSPGHGFDDLVVVVLDPADLSVVRAVVIAATSLVQATVDGRLLLTENMLANGREVTAELQAAERESDVSLSEPKRFSPSILRASLVLWDGPGGTLTCERVLPYRDGFEIELKARGVQAHGHEGIRGRSHRGFSRYSGLQLSVSFSDGRVGRIEDLTAEDEQGPVTITPFHRKDSSPDVLWHWVMPLPPAGPVRLEVTWMRFGIDGAHVEFDGPLARPER